MRRILLLAVAALSVLPSWSAAPRQTFARRRPAVSGRAAKQAVPQKSVSSPVQGDHCRSPYVGAIVVNADTGDVIFEDNADREAYPASVTKLMTLLLVMEDVRAGRYALDDKVSVSADVRYSVPSCVGLKAGDRMSVFDLCAALMVKSANDAAMALGAHSAGAWDAFVARMNARAAELGMKGTRFYNPNGLQPTDVDSRGRVTRFPWKSTNVTTARDQALLARRLVKMPEVLSLTAIKTCDLVKTSDGFRVSVTLRTNEPRRATELASGEEMGGTFVNHNNVMVKDKLKILNPDGKEAVDGMKTGYTRDAGSSVVLTGSRRGKRAIVVVLGSSSSKERDEHARRLLSDALGALAW